MAASSSESKSFLYGCGVDWEMVHGWLVVQLVFVYKCRSIIAVLHRCPLTHSKAFCSHCGDNGCALRCDCRRKSIYPSRALLMTLPAGSVLLQQEAFSRLDGVMELGGGRGGWAFKAGRPLSHRTQLFQDTGCTFDMCLLTLPMMPATPPSTSGSAWVVSSPHRGNGVWGRSREVGKLLLLHLCEEGNGKDVERGL